MYIDDSKILDNTKSMKKLMQIVKKQNVEESVKRCAERCGLTPQTYVRRVLFNKFFY